MNVDGLLGEETTKKFWMRVQITDTCWLWRGYIASNGYGGFWFDGKYRAAHRVSWCRANGTWPGRWEFVCHRCDNPICVNPEHLFLGTPKDNIQDSINKGRFIRWNSLKTHCKHGHPFDEENTIIDYRGHRECRTCKRIWEKKQPPRKRDRRKK